MRGMPLLRSVVHHFTTGRSILTGAWRDDPGDPAQDCAADVASHLLATALIGQRRATLVDIGEDTGTRLEALLERIAAVAIRPPMLDIVAIDESRTALAA